MKPFIISHMMSSVDGRIDCDMTELIDTSDIYYEALETLDCPSQLMGRVTMQLHYAAPQPFTATDKSPIGHEDYRMATSAEGYTIAIDSHGSLIYLENTADGKPLLVITAECCPKAYTDYLNAHGISWIATGKEHINLPRAMEMAAECFGIRRLAVVGGGHINGAFLTAGLLNEISLMIGPGIDGRSGMATVFDGIQQTAPQPVLLDLKSVKQVGNGTVWLRYTPRH